MPVQTTTRVHHFRSMGASLPAGDPTHEPIPAAD